MNPADKFILKGKGKSKGNKRIQYRWEVKRCDDVEDDCPSVKEETLKNFSSKVLDNDGTSLIIKPGFFKGIKLVKLVLNERERERVEES